MEKTGEASPARASRLWHGVSAWGLALGCVIGWGSFVMPGTTFLLEAGPAGTALGLLLATAVIAMVAANYSFLERRFPEDGGSYRLTKRILGDDHSFLAAWSLALAYLSLLWANATAFVLIGRYLLGGVFQWGFHYTLAGYDVYLGEVVTTIAIQTAFGLLVCFADKVATGLRTVAAAGLVVAVAALAAGAAGTLGTDFMAEPLFAPQGGPEVRQVLGVAILAPWLFVGFETVFHEPRSGALSIRATTAAAVAAVVCGAGVYVLLVLVAASGAPAGFSSWPEYVANLGSLSGFDGMPVLRNARAALGQAGVGIAAAAVFCALSTSLLGFYRAAARVIQTMAADGLLPTALAREEGGVPRRAILVIMAISLPVPLLGRTAVGWNADVSTLSVAIVYAYLSLCAFKTARSEGSRAAQATGVAGLVASGIIFFMLLVPNIFFESALATESYFMLGAWSLLGILYYWIVFRRDHDHRFGRSTAMWIMMLFLLLFSVNVWTRLDAQRQLTALGPDAAQAASDVLARSSLVQMAVVVVALVVMFSLFTTMMRRERELDLKVIAAEERTKAKTSFLSNMSHDIRTPMNAIVGFTNLAMQSAGDEEQTRTYLGKIKASSDHLLSLINDVLEMSRIESGKIELDYAPVDLVRTMDDLQTIITGQAEAKHQTLSVSMEGVSDPVVSCDKLRLNQVLLNLLSNAIKYTPEGGAVDVRLIQTAPAANGRAPYEIRVKDNGIGMTPEFAARVFEAFEREKSDTVAGIQGTGLGMAITKRIVDQMGGAIEVETALGEGSEFIVSVSLEVCDPDAADAQTNRAQEAGSALAARLAERPMRLLLVDDNEINREIASTVLEMSDFLVEEASDGQEAVNAVASHEPGYYDAVLMDVIMPVMNGYEATAAIRALADEGRANVPIVAVTANAFDEDRRAAFDAGMDGHVPKPIDADVLMATLEEVFSRREGA